MDEQEQKNSSDSFLRQQVAEGKEKIKDEAKKKAKKKVMAKIVSVIVANLPIIGIILGVAIVAVVLICRNIICCR